MSKRQRSAKSAKSTKKRARSSRKANKHGVGSKTIRNKKSVRTSKTARTGGKRQRSTTATPVSLERSKNADPSAVTSPPPGVGVSRGRSAPPSVSREAGRVVVVVETSNNGPLDIRAITVNERMVITNVATTAAQNRFDITAQFRPSARIGWEIFAGIQFPRAGVFLERTGQPIVTLGQQAPLKRGVPWLDQKAVEN